VLQLDFLCWDNTRALQAIPGEVIIGVPGIARNCESHAAIMFVRLGQTNSGHAVDVDQLQDDALFLRLPEHLFLTRSSIKPGTHASPGFDLQISPTWRRNSGRGRQALLQSLVRLGSRSIERVAFIHIPGAQPTIARGACCTSRSARRSISPRAICSDSADDLRVHRSQRVGATRGITCHSLTSSTRRLLAFPSGVAFESMGFAAPYPFAVRRDASIP
jgi:hypothetical protein